jgi:hypothetical protein
LRTLCLRFLAFSLIFFSCHNPAPPITEDFSYPLRVGNKWEYSHTATGINFKVPVNDSVFVPKDTQESFGSTNNFISVDRIDSTSLPMAMFVIHDSSSVPGDTFSWVGENWYRNTADGLYKYAIDFPGGPQASPKTAAGARVLYRFKGKLFSSAREISDFVMNGFSPYSAKRLAAPAGLTVYDPPQGIYRYPYKAGALWDFINTITDSIRIAKEYINKEEITTPAGTFACYKVQWLWDWNHDGIWDTGQEGNDWVSPVYGLVKRQMIARDFQDVIYDPASGNLIIIAKFDMVDEYTLIGMDVR